MLNIEPRFISVPYDSEGQSTTDKSKQQVNTEKQFMVVVKRYFKDDDNEDRMIIFGNLIFTPEDEINT